MKRFDIRVLLGGGLMLLGGLLFLEQFNLLQGASGLFWGVVLAVLGAFFLRVFFQQPGSNWWALLPAFALFGMAVDNFLPERWEAWGGLFFLGGIGLAFWAIYFTDRSRWWAIIPGGVLLTLGVTGVLDDFLKMDGSGGVFFMGLGLTFLLVALLPNPVTNTRWAYIPAAVLVLMGALVGSREMAGLANYVWPLALIVVGLGLIAGFFIRKD